MWQVMLIGYGGCKLDVCGGVDVVLTWRSSTGGGGDMAGDVDRVWWM